MAKPDKTYDTNNLLQKKDWELTPLGAPASWSAELRQTTSLLFASVQPMFLLWGEERTFLFNDAFREILGDRYSEAIGEPLPQVWAQVWSEVEPFVNDAFAGKSSIVQDKPFKTWASDYKETRYYTFSYTPIRDAAGVTLGAFCVATDTTDSVTATHRVRSERDRLRSLFDEAPVFLAMGTTPDMRFTYANRAYGDLVARDDLIGKTVTDLLPEAEAQGFRALLEEVSSSGKPFVGQGMPYVRRGPGEPETRYIDFVYQPVFEDDGSVGGILCAGYDVTEQHRSRQEAANLRMRLEQTARLGAMANMAATLAHELNQPLAAAANYISGGLRSAQRLEGFDAERVKVALEAANRQVLKSGEIIRRARTAVSNSGPIREPVALVSVVESALISARAAGSLGGGVSARCEIDPHLTVLIDLIQIEQVLHNLIRNASCAMNGNGSIKITAEVQEGTVSISVADDGPGLAEEKVECLFTPFVHSVAGMGVGLSICRTIVEAHGGNIAALNGQSGGAVFKFTLPAA